MSYNVRDKEERLDQEMNEKCLNGEQDVEKKQQDGKAKSRGGLLARLKDSNTNKISLILILLCVLLVVFFIIIIALAVRVGWLERRTLPSSCDTAECLAASTGIARNWNTTFDPCQDFWRFSCGNWINKHPLPHNRGSIGVAESVRGTVRSRLRHLLDLVPPHAEVRDPEWKAQRFYHSCMNVQAVEQTENAFRNIINEVGGWILLNNWSEQRWDRNDILRQLHVDYGVTPFFKVVVEPDDAVPTANIIKILPSGLGLPGPSYYFKAPGNKYETIYKAFMNDVARQFGARGSDASRFAENTFNYEKRLAEITPPLEAYRDPYTHYKKLTIRQLSSVAPTVPWLEILQQYYSAANIDYTTEVNVFNETYFKHLSAIISSTDNGALHNYFMWQFSLLYAPHLSADLRQIANRFFQSLEGVENPSLNNDDRWEYCLKVTSQYLGHALGAMYVKHYFVPESSEEASAVEKQIQKAFKENLDHVPWVEDSPTREYMREKMGSLLSLRGYPDFIISTDVLSNYYKELNVQSDFLQNIIKGKYFLRKKQESQLSSQVTLEESWTIFPQDVQAIYQYYGNHLVVPAGLLQEPLFDPASPLSVRFGSLGTHLGSEMFKALDDKGILYQKLGVLDPWLSERSAAEFQSKSECLKNKLLEDEEGNTLHANLTVGEFIADLAAVKFSYRAYRSMEREEELPGLGKSHDQVFFISYAQSMCEVIKPEKEKVWLDYSLTSPKQKRVLNTLRQMPEFSEAFSCPAGSNMNPGRSCGFW